MKKILGLQAQMELASNRMIQFNQFILMISISLIDDDIIKWYIFLFENNYNLNDLWD